MPSKLKAFCLYHEKGKGAFMETIKSTLWHWSLWRIEHSGLVRRGGGAGVDGTSNTRDLQRPGVLGFHLLLDELLAHLWASVFFICKGGLIHLMPYRVLARILKVTNKKEFKCSLLDKSIGQKKPQRRHGGLVAHRGLKSNSHSHSVWFQLLWVSWGRGTDLFFPAPNLVLSKCCQRDMLRQPKGTRTSVSGLPLGPAFWDKENNKSRKCWAKHSDYS